MARHGLSRPPLPPEGILRRSPVPHDQWSPGHLTGSLLLALETPPGQYVSPSTGRLTLTRMEGQEIVAQQAARRADLPVLPGSGIKGAVRTLYELLSFSCNPFAGIDRSRRRDPGEICTKHQCCDACSLFGLLGWTGRVSFQDAVPAPPDAVQVQVRKVPIPWQPDGSKTGGDFRFYDLEEARQFVPERRTWEKRPKELAREVFVGRFTTRLMFTNVQPVELGRLLLAMGLRPDGTPQLHLRLGGVKYDGKGAVKVSLLELSLATTHQELKGESCSARCAEWMHAAQTSPWGTLFLPTLEELADTLETTD